MANRWFGPRYVPSVNSNAKHGSCGCCGCAYYAGDTIADIDELPHEPGDFYVRESLSSLYNGTYRPFLDGATIRLVVSSIPNVLSWTQFVSQGARTITFDEFTVTGFGGLNGTFLQDVEKSQYGCLMTQAGKTFQIPTKYRVAGEFGEQDTTYELPETGYLSSQITVTFQRKRVRHDYDSGCGSFLTVETLQDRTLYLRWYYRVNRFRISPFGGTPNQDTRAFQVLEIGLVSSNFIYTDPFRGMFYPSFLTSNTDIFRRMYNDLFTLVGDPAYPGDIVVESIGWTGRNIDTQLTGNLEWRGTEQSNVAYLGPRTKTQNVATTVCGTDYNFSFDLTGNIGSYTADVLR